MTDFISQYSIPLQILLPLIAAIVCFISPSVILKRSFSLLTSLILVIVTTLQAIHVFEQQQAIQVLVGNWLPPLGIKLLVDGFSSVLLSMTAVIGLAIVYFSIHYFSGDDKESRFWPLWWFLNAALIGVFTSSDIFNTYIMLELLGLASVSLVALQGTQKALQASYQYLLVGLFGSLLYLLGVAILYRTYGVLDNALLAEMAQRNLSTLLALVFITIGMLLKCALFPLHFWLPEAHSNASAPVSAILSGLVIKAAFFILFNFWFEILPIVITSFAVSVIGVLGATAVVYGAYRAFTALRLKLLIAYSTVAQIGYLFLAFPLMLESPQQARIAVMYFIVAHGSAKAAMFLSAGAIQKAVGHDNLHELKGIAAHLPVSIFIFAVTSASLIGLPPSGGFIAKWLMLNTALQTGQWWWVITLFVGGLLASAYLFRVLNLAFTTAQQESTFSVSYSEKKLLGAAALSLITIIIGLNAVWLTQMIGGNV